MEIIERKLKNGNLKVTYILDKEELSKIKIKNLKCINDIIAINLIGKMLKIKKRR